MPRRVAEVVAGALPAPGPARVLVLSGLTGAVGTGLFLAGSMLFFVRSVGLTPYQVAVGLGAAGVVGMVGSVPAGAVADRIGPRRTVVALHLWRAVAYALYLAVDSFPAFLVVVCATTLADKATPAINQAMVGQLFGERERLRTMGFLRAAQNVGLSVGALLAALALASGSRFGYDLLALGNALSYIVMAVLVWRLRETVPVANASGGAPAATAGAGRPLREPSYLMLSLTNGALALHDTVLFVGLPLWIAEHTAAPPEMIGLMLTVNTVATALSQVWWTRLTSTVTGAARGMVVAGGVLAAASVAIGLAGTATAVAACACWLLLGVLLLTAGENLHVASAWELSYALSPQGGRSRYLAVFHLGQSARDLVGPLAVTALLVGLGGWGWLALAAGFVVAGVAARQAAFAAGRRRLPRAPRPLAHPAATGG